MVGVIALLVRLQFIVIMDMNIQKKKKNLYFIIKKKYIYIIFLSIHLAIYKQLMEKKLYLLHN